MSKYIMLILVSLSVILVLLPISCNKYIEKRTVHERTFNSNLQLDIVTINIMGCNFEHNKCGETPAQAPISIPDCRWWVVVPRVSTANELNWSQLAQEIRSSNIPGIGSMRKTTDAHLRHLKNIQNLRYIAVMGRGVTDTGLNYITNNHELQGIRLWQTNISDDGLQCLKHFPDLRSIYIYHAGITGKNAPIDKLTKLWRLVLDRTNYSDEGLDKIKELNNLQVLDITWSNVTNKGLVNLKGLTKLRMLHLTGTKIDDEGLQCLYGLKELRILHLYHTNVTREGHANFFCKISIIA